MTHLSLFSGIGGLDLAAEWAGFETVAFVERDAFCQKVLAKHWPGVPIFDDVTTFGRETLADADDKPDGKASATAGPVGSERDSRHDVSRGSRGLGIDLLSGGFPCQPFSVAGKRGGTSDSRFLWHEMLRVIREVEPVWVLGENVRGLLSIDGGRTFGTIIHELAEVGYRVGWGVYGACHVAAPHRRERVFIVANRARDEQGRQEQRAERERAGAEGESKSLANPSGVRCQGGAEWEHRSAQEGRGMPKPQPGSVWLPEPGVGRVATGISNRVDRLRSLGNAVVPAQASPILKAIADQIRGAA